MAAMDREARKGMTEAQPGASVEPTAAHGSGAAATQAGDAAIRRMAAAPASAPGIGDPEKLAQESLFSADASATATEGEEVYREGHVRVRFDPGTRFSVRLDPGGLHLTADPGLVVDVPGPNLRLTSMSYDFQTGHFVTAGHARFDLFGAYAGIAMRVAERALDEKVKPLLPARVQKPGYSTATDPDLRGTVAALAKTFAFTAGAHDGEAGGAGTPKAPHLVDPSASTMLEAPRDLHVPLGIENLELFLQQGTLIEVTADGAGPVDHPKLKRLDVTSQGPGIQIQSTGKGIKDVFMGLTMNRITVLPGGRFDFDYDLVPEQMGDGLEGLLALLDMASGHDPGPLEKVKLQSVRKELDARLQKEVPARFKAYLAQLDHVVPGFSLTDLFGVS